MRNDITNPRPIVSTIHHEVDLASPTADMIHPDDIALAMARVPRYNGLTNVEVSVGQHLLLCEKIADRIIRLKDNDVSMPGWSDPSNTLLYILLHDAHEAYTGDLNRPMKALLDTASNGLVSTIERRLDKAIFERFGLPDKYAENNPDIISFRKKVDDLALSVETQLVFPVAQERWEGMPDASGYREDLYQILALDQPAVFHMMHDRWEVRSPKLRLEYAQPDEGATPHG